MKILMALLFMPMAAFAADWVLIGATQEIEIEIDQQSVRPNKGAWFKLINTPPASDSCAEKGKKLAYSKNYIEARCKEFSIRTKQTIVYAEDGSVLRYCGYDDPKAVFVEYAPETVGETFFKAICDPNGRVESKFAVYVRESKPRKEPLFAECKTSSDCAGNLLCKSIGTTPVMRCFSPD